jgi:hypothetical protein
MEQFIQVYFLLQGKQPIHILLPTYFLQLSPSPLVFDRKEGFFRKQNATLIFTDGSKKQFQYSEYDENLPNSLEKMLMRRAFTNFFTPEIINYYFCEYHLKTLGAKPLVKVKEVTLFSANDLSYSTRVICGN